MKDEQYLILQGDLTTHVNLHIKFTKLKLLSSNECSAYTQIK